MTEHFPFTHSVSLVPSGLVCVCPGENATFTCMTTGGVLLWETSSATRNHFFSSANDQPERLGIFDLKLFGFNQRMVGNLTILEVNSSATVTNVQPGDNGVTLNCTETTGLDEDQAVLIAGKLCAE